MRLQLADRQQLVNFIKEQIASVTNESIDYLDEEMSFLKLGISSIQTIMIINKIKKKLDIDINPIAMFEYKNISEFATYLGEFIIQDNIFHGE